jgi:hypothetical protein
VANRNPIPSRQVLFSARAKQPRYRTSEEVKAMAQAQVLGLYSKPGFLRWLAWKERQRRIPTVSK